MSFFPPPPPAPPLATQGYPPDNYASTPNGFRGRGSGPFRGRGFRAHARGTARSRPAFSGRSSNTTGHLGHHNYEGGPPAFTTSNGGRYASNGYPPGRDTNPQLNATVSASRMQGPPIHLGSHEQRYTISSVTASNGQGHRYGFNRGGTVNSSHVSSHSPSQVYDSRSSKRGYGEAFGRGRQAQSASKGHAPPCVPSFGGALPQPTKPEPLSAELKGGKVQKRKYNQLGLTPKTGEHELSDDAEEDDQDEETRLATTATNGTGQLPILQVNYKGRTSTLQSSADIAAWIAERRKRFPTKARVAEAAEQEEQREQAKSKAHAAQREQRDREVRESKGSKRQRAAENVDAKRDSEVRQSPKDPEEIADRRKRKVEKLRNRLAREEQRIAKAEATATKKKRSPTPSSFNVDRSPPDVGTIGESSPKTAIGVIASEELASALPTSASQLPSLNDADQTKVTSEEPSVLEIEPDWTDSEDLTSSSGSDSSDSDGAPEEKTSKADEPRRMDSKRQKTTRLCKYFIATGRCRSGASCRFKHELPPRGNREVKNKAARSQVERGKERISLYQRLVGQEKKLEEEALLDTIIHLGDTGVLEQAVDSISGVGT